jgi:hypothetical protein
MKKHELMKEHLLAISQNGYNTTAKTIDELTIAERPQIDIPLEKKVEMIKKDPMLTAYIMSEHPKATIERMSYNEFVKLVNKLQRESK